MPSAADPLSVVEDLPPEHLALLRGVLCGFDTAGIAALAGVPPEAVLPLVRVAVAKLATAVLDDLAAARVSFADEGGDGR